jgi:quercetin dioxygenase-like cupin family protein
MTFRTEKTPGQDRGTPTPGAHPNGYMLRPGEGTLTWFDRALITFMAKSADTRGIAAFFKCEVPYGWQSPVHRHANESDMFYITEGEWEIFVNDTVHLVTPGCTVWIPPATPHSIFVRSQRGTGFCYVTPAGFEVFFEEAGEPATVPSMPTHQTQQPSVADLQQLGANLGWELVEPEPRRLNHPQ